MTGVTVELRLNDGSFVTGMIRSGQSLSQFKKELERVDPHFRKLNQNSENSVRAITKVTQTNRDLLGTMRDLAIITSAVSYGFDQITGASGNLIGSITSINAEIEKLGYQMQGMSTSAQPIREAAASVEYLRQRALQMPFSLNGIADSFVKLKTTGIDPSERALQSLADGIAAFGGSDEQLHRVSLGIQQMYGKSVIQMEEMRQQIGESMPTAMKIMARSMGVSVAELTNAIATGRVEASAALDTFYRELERTYGGESQRMMGSFAGQVSQLKANLQFLATEGGMKTFFHEQKAALKDLNTFLQSNEARAWADDIGKSLTSVTRFLRQTVRVLYELREEIALVAKVVAGAMGFRLLTSIIGKTSSAFTLLRGQIASTATSARRGARAFALGTTAMSSYGMSARAAGLAVSGFGVAVRAVGSVVMATLPWLGLIAAGLAVVVDKFNLLGSSSEDAYQKLREGGVSSKTEALRILDDQEKEIRARIDRFEAGSNDYSIFGGKARRARSAELLEQAKKDLKAFQSERDRILRDNKIETSNRNIRNYSNELNERLQVHTVTYRKMAHEAQIAMESELANAAETGKKTHEIRKDFRDKNVKLRKEQSKAIIDTIDQEIKKYEELLGKVDSKSGRQRISEILDYQRARRMEAVREMEAADQTGIKLVPSVDSNETRVKRAGKLLNKLEADVSKLRASFLGAGGAAEKLRFQIARGDYGSVEEGGEAVQRLHDSLLAATEQKEALDRLMKGKKKVESDILRAETAAVEKQMELEERRSGRKLTQSERIQARISRGIYDGIGPSKVLGENMTRISGVSVQVSKAARDVGDAIAKEAFGSASVDRINRTERALLGVKSRIDEISAGLGSLNMGSVFGPMSRPIGKQVSDGSYSTQIAYNMGPKRPGKPNQVIIDAIARAAEEALGKNAKVEIYSGKGEHGSPRHRNGSAADVRFYDPEGNIVTLDDPRAKDIAMASARHGISGFGAGKEYMGNTGFHLDMYPWEKYSSQMGPVWGSFGKSIRAELTSVMRDFRSDSATRPISAPSGTQADVAILEARKAQIDADVAKRLEEIKALEDKNAVEESAIKIQEATAKAIEAQNSISRGGFETETNRYDKGVERISAGNFGSNRDPSSPDFSEYLSALKELDRLEKEKAVRDKAYREGQSSLKKLEEERAQVVRRLGEEQRRIDDPDYAAQSSELQRLIKDLDRFVLAQKKAYGEGSSEYRAALSRRSEMIAEQRRLEATTRQADLAAEIRDVRDGLMSQSDLRRVSMGRDLRRVDRWIADARKAGLSEVDIVRQSEEAKAAIRDKYAAESDPVSQQMKEWRDYSSAIASSTTSWMDSAATGIAGLITGTGDLRGVLNSVLSDIANAQVRFLYSSAFGDKTSGAASKISGGAKGGSKGGSVLAGVRHTGGMANLMGTTRPVSPSVFADAPRFHTGGIVGMPRLQRDEVPIIAQKEEGVFTKEQMAALAPVGSGNQAFQINAPVTVNGSAGTPDQNQDLAKKMAREMEKTMRGVVVSEIRNQSRNGGMVKGGVR